jgi:hypothetical protein
MRKLAAKIETELKEQEVCAVYNSELARVWPPTISPEKRKQEIKRFADEHQLAVTFYDVGLCAIFERRGRGSQENRDLTLPLPRKPSKLRKKRSR